jgi:hypothetical protein
VEQQQGDQFGIKFTQHAPRPGADTGSVAVQLTGEPACCSGTWRVLIGRLTTAPGHTLSKRNYSGIAAKRRKKHNESRHGNDSGPISPAPSGPYSIPSPVCVSCASSRLSSYVEAVVQRPAGIAHARRLAVFDIAASPPRLERGSGLHTRRGE